MVSVKRFTDRYNPKKVWVLKHYPCGHYYLNQEVAGKMFYKRFIHTTKRQITDIGFGGDSLW